MRAKHNTALEIRQVWDAWMTLDNPDMSIDEAVKKLENLGNEILEIDRKGRRIKVLHTDSDDERWCCDFCPVFSKYESDIVKHEETHKGVTNG